MMKCKLLLAGGDYIHLKGQLGTYALEEERSFSNDFSQLENGNENH